MTDVLQNLISKYDFLNVSAFDVQSTTPDYMKPDHSALADGTSAIVQFGFRQNFNDDGTTVNSVKISVHGYNGVTKYYTNSVLISKNNIFGYQWTYNGGNYSGYSHAITPNNWYWVYFIYNRLSGGSSLEIKVYDNPNQSGTPLFDMPVSTFYTTNLFYVEFQYNTGATIHNGTFELTPMPYFAGFANGAQSQIAWSSSQCLHVPVPVTSIRTNEYNLSMDNVIMMDYDAYMIALRDAAKNLTDSSTGAGLPSPTARVVTGSFGSDLSSALSTLADTIDDDFSSILPEFHLHLGNPFNGIADMGNSLGNNIIGGIKAIGVAMTTGFKVWTNSMGGFVDDSLSIVQAGSYRAENYLNSQGVRILSYIKRFISFSVDDPTTNYIQINKLTSALQVIDNFFPSLLTNFKLQYTRTYPAALLQGGSFPTSFRIPTHFKVNIFGQHISFNMFDIILFTILGPAFATSKSQKVPASEYGLYDLNVPDELARSVLGSGTGFTFEELSKDSIIYGTPLVVLAIISYFLGTDVTKEIISVWRSIDPLSPTISDLVTYMGVSHDAFNNLTGPSLTSQISTNLKSSDSRLNNLDSKISDAVQTSDSRLSNLDSKISYTSQTSDSRFNNLDSKISETAQTADSRFSYLDSPISETLRSDDSRLNFIDHSIDDVANQLSSDSPLGSLVKSSFKSIYTLNKFAFVHKRDLSSINSLLSLISITNLSIDAIIASIDTVISSNDTSDSEHDLIVDSNTKINLVNEILNSDIKWNEFVRVLARYLV